MFAEHCVLLIWPVCVHWLSGCGTLMGSGRALEAASNSPKITGVLQVLRWV
jgi:predicted membrane protein